ncbi:MAG: hypothetical protein SGILL_003435 [Bacillariaceae sp.]
MKRPLCEDAESSSSIASSTDACSRNVVPSKRVSFFASVKVQFVECLDEYSQEEKVASWFNREDFDQFKRDRRSTVKVMDQGNRQVDDGHHYFRGVEAKTRIGSQRKQWNMIEASMVVFDEQMHHQQYPIDSETTVQAIAASYSSVVADARAAAAERGLHDQHAALDACVARLIFPADSESTPTRMQRRLSCRAA